MHKTGCLERELHVSGVWQSWKNHEDGLFKMIPHCSLQHYNSRSYVAADNRTCWFADSLRAGSGRFRPDPADR